MVGKSQLGVVLVMVVRLGLTAVGVLPGMPAGGLEASAGVWSLTGLVIPLVDSFVRSGGLLVWQALSLGRCGAAPAAAPASQPAASAA